MILITQATDGQFKAFYGVERDSNIVAYAVHKAGQIVAMFGATLQKEYAVLFSDIVGKHQKIVVWRVAAVAMQCLRRLNMPLIAYTDKAGRFLESLGFYQEGDYYRYVD